MQVRCGEGVLENLTDPCSCTPRLYDWFTEGFDTRDLKEAKALLDEFAA
jgi:hypothetical protein